MIKWLKDIFKEESNAIQEEITEEEWAEMFEKARRADKARNEYWERLKKENPKEYRLKKISEKFSAGL